MSCEHSSNTTPSSRQYKIVAKDTDTDGDLDKRRLAEIAGIPFTDGWSAFDSNEEKGLYLLHSDVEPKRAGLPRGIVVDLERGVMICSSFGFTPTAPMDCLSLIPGTDGDLAVTDEHLNQHIFKHNNYCITPAYEGVIVRVFKHDGIVYFSTHKKLDCSRSRWGRSDYFLDIYKKLGGPSGSDLFPEDVLYSPWCYIFLLVDRELLVATKQDIGVGYIVDLGLQQMWEYSPEGPFKTTEDDGEDSRTFAGPEHRRPIIVSALEGKLNFTGGEESFLVRPCQLSLEEANRFLKQGYLNEDEDEEVGSKFSGESVILYQYDDSGRLSDSVRVQSQGYHWRIRMRGDNPNLRHRFYQLLNDALKPDNVDSLLSKYPLFYRREKRDKRRDTIWVDHCGQSIELDLRQTDDRIFLVYVTFYESLPAAQKSEGMRLWDDFKKDRDDVTAWIQDLASGETAPPEDEDGNPYLTPRLQNILRLTKEHAVNRQRQGRDRNRYGKRMRYDFLVKANIRNLILRESGTSLFRLIREMRRAERSIELKEE